MKNKNTTDSLNLAAYLAIAGFHCRGIEREQSSPKFLFIFDISEDDFSSYSDSFWSQQTQVDALSYAQSLKTLKSRIYQHKNQERKYGKTNQR